VKRPALLCALLLYVTLDLSLPMMPGAFVFEPADSVESTQLSRPRVAAEVVVVPAPSRDAFALSQPRVEADHRFVPRSRVEHRAPSVANRLPRSRGDAAPPSEDPH
jgi:hypothetical protein